MLFRHREERKSSISARVRRTSASSTCCSSHSVPKVRPNSRPGSQKRKLSPLSDRPVSCKVLSNDAVVSNGDAESKVLEEERSLIMKRPMSPLSPQAAFTDRLPGETIPLSEIVAREAIKRAREHTSASTKFRTRKLTPIERKLFER